MKNTRKMFQREIYFMESAWKVSRREKGCEFLDFETDKFIIQ